MANTKNHNPDRPMRKRVSREESDFIDNIRALIEQEGLGISDVKHGWQKTENASLFFTNPNYKPTDVRRFEEMADQLVERVAESAPSFPRIVRKKNDHGHLLVVDPADVHIGKLASSFETGEEYNSQIAVRRVIEGVHGILQKARMMKIDKILFVAGNDILHIDSPRKAVTTSGTPQDTDGMWFENFLVAERLYRDVLQTLMSVADVHFVYNPSNHDYMTGFLLARTIAAYFKDSKNITFDIDLRHRKAFRYGNNLIGTTHGDGAKQQDLPLLLAQEFSEDWAATKHRYIYVHHIHHKTSKDYPGVTVESMRSPSSADGWHHRSGYQHAPKAIEGFIHCPIHGQVVRITHLF